METVQRKREVWIDYLRVIACFMVLTVHSTEPFYLGGEGSQILSLGEGIWAAIFLSVTRGCVALFVIASSYLQFPIHYPTGEFLRRRATRVLVPLVVWLLIYAFYWGEPVHNLRDLLVNFNYSAGHLWFVYMLIGLYLLMPLLSPWAEKVGKKELQAYICIWLFTSLIPFIRDYLGGGQLSMTYGTGGLPQFARYPVWGEASWNLYGTFYYFSGFIGYLLLGLYLRKFVGELSWGKTLSISIPCLLGGFAICGGGFLRRIFVSSGGEFPYSGPLSQGVWWETSLFNDALGTVLVTIGFILIIRKISCEGKFYRKVVLPVSQASYGMYLGHMIILAAFSGLFLGIFGRGEEGILGIWTPPVEILLTAICSYTCAAIAAVLIRKIPKVGKWIIG